MPTLSQIATLLIASAMWFVTGCASYSAIKNPEDTSFVKVSKGSAGGFVAPVAGEGSYCMIEKHNIEVTAAVEYADGECRVVLQAQ